MRVRFGRWELRPDKSGNWALWQLRAARDGSAKWLPLERYFQWSTVGNALWFAANEELMEGNEDEALAFQEFAEQWRDMTQAFLRDASESLGGAS